MAGDGALFVDGRKVAEGPIDRTMGFRISLDETFDIGSDAEDPVSEDYRVPFDFEGKLNFAEIYGLPQEDSIKVTPEFNSPRYNLHHLWHVATVSPRYHRGK